MVCFHVVLVNTELTTRSDTYSYNIPKNLPSGDYLLRFEQLGIHNPYPLEHRNSISSAHKLQLQMGALGHLDRSSRSLDGSPELSLATLSIFTTA
jgi:hypothetical protein